MVIKILGMGCPNCKKLEANTRKALEELGLTATIEKVQDMDLITGYGVMRTPGLVVDETLKSSGKVLTTEEVKALLM
ncbi:MAG: thioredoxin family protein [Acholeplasmataceae bacterium]|nr:MAG: thioredoxin family protein [Acholeplasmataceae bacterium]